MVNNFKVYIYRSYNRNNIIATCPDKVSVSLVAFYTLCKQTKYSFGRYLIISDTYPQYAWLVSSYHAVSFTVNLTTASQRKSFPALSDKHFEKNDVKVLLVPIPRDLVLDLLLSWWQPTAKHDFYYIYKNFNAACANVSVGTYLERSASSRKISVIMRCGAYLITLDIW